MWFADGYQEYTADDLQNSLASFGGETLCEDRELQVVDFIAGHTDAFIGQDNNCVLYSAAAEAAAACEEDKQKKHRIYCELGKYNLPPIPEMFKLCRVPPNLQFRYGLFYDCVLREPHTWDCRLSTTAVIKSSLSRVAASGCGLPRWASTCQCYRWLANAIFPCSIHLELHLRSDNNNFMG